MHTLVTGGAGFIGSNLVRLLRSEGHTVTVLDNLLSGHRKNLDAHPEVRFVEGDIRDANAVNQGIEGAEVVFHLAASVGNKRSIDLPMDDADVNLLGTLQVLEAVRRHGVRKIVFSSSAGVFGELKTLPIREDHPLDPDSPYGASKLAAEKVCLAYGRLYGFEAVCLRYFNVFGVHQRFDAYGNVIPIFAHRMIAGEPVTIYGDGEQTRDFVNVRDVAQANLRAALAHGVSGAFNIASGTSITINDLVRLMQEKSDLRATVQHGPPRPGDVRHSLADLTLAREKLGFDPVVGLGDGLEEYLRWAVAESTR
jgi:UDP-glucose 4-epimerase